MKTFNSTYKRCGIALAVIAVISTFSSCKKSFLDRPFQGQYTSEDYPYPGGSGPYDTYINGAYSMLRDYNVSATPFITAVSIRSDDADKGSTAADGGSDAQTMDNFPVLPTNGMTNALWTGYYSLIDKANIVLDQVANNKDIAATAEVKAQSEAEAKFIRAYGYFMLVRLFGRVPIIDKVLSDPAAQANIPQSEPAAVYTLIESDLQFAATNLPVSWDPKFIGRATSGAANGMLAKVYLTQKKWGAAMGAANMVINSGQYDLSISYDQVFRETGENTKESVFEIQGTATATEQTAYGIQYASVQGVRGPGVWDMGWGWNTPSTILEGTYETGDPRKARTFLYASTLASGETPEVINKTIYGESMPFYPSEVPNPAYNGKVYTDPSKRAQIGNRMGWWMDVRVLRYADVVLMYAEAANESGNTAEALAKLEMVRARARGGDASILPAVTTTDQEELRQAIRHERRVELAMEHDRFFDLVRWGTAGQALQAAGKSNFNNSRDVLLPIPQTQIDLSKGKLTQNTGY